MALAALDPFFATLDAHFAAAIDDLAIYDDVLTASTIADIMANNPTELASVFSKVQYVSKGVATIIGPTLSGLLVAYNWRFSYLVSSLLCAVNLFVCVPKLVQRVPPPKPGANLARHSSP